MGYFPYAPGSLCSLLASVFAGLLGYFGGYREYISTVFLAVAIILFIPGILWGSWAIECFKRKDPREFVLDEFVGQIVALLWLLPTTKADFNTYWGIITMQFILFRIFDILKPFPLRRLETLPSGLGIMADDIAAGIYANIAGRIIYKIFGL